MVRVRKASRRPKERFFTPKDILILLLSSIFTATVILNSQNFEQDSDKSNEVSFSINQRPTPPLSIPTTSATQEASILDGARILVAIVAYDFSQAPHLEEVLDGYLDLCAAGSWVDVVIYATIAWPVAYIDMLNTRFHCANTSPKAGFTISIHLKSPDTRLHLVDFHRELFYERLEDYTLFIYTEDDIRVSPRTVATYLYETKQVIEKLGAKTASDFNVGIVRYEYNYPSNIIIDDGTRHATQNVTRVYWEHSWQPPIGKSVDIIPQNGMLPGYIHMSNHHQGMYLATQDLLRAWKDRPGCEFNVIKNRPHAKGQPHQPSEGTQRVWMSSQQLYGNRHCNVQQLLPMETFGALTVLHLPNKNYRRVGRKGRLGGSKDKQKEMEDISAMQAALPVVSSRLLTAMQLHIALRTKWPPKPQLPYNGIVMLDQVEGRQSNDPQLVDRMKTFRAYVERGGIMSNEDMENTVLA
ncbi:MAG: hypothetical protein SGBAC_007932 [Bacillariaceae sp.]